jgi:hypothetical protein
MVGMGYFGAFFNRCPPFSVDGDNISDAIYPVKYLPVQFVLFAVPGLFCSEHVPYCSVHCSMPSDFHFNNGKNAWAPGLGTK